MYKLLRSFLFLFDPEGVHYLSMNGLRIICKIPGGKKLLAAFFVPKGNFQFSIFNIQFPNKVGLGAGFDKNAQYLNELEALGFGFVEIGTVTPTPQAGNDKPRLFRLPKDKALINRMGFNNEGVEAVVKNLKAWRQKKSTIGNQQSKIIIGGNIGKNKLTPNEDAWKDYEICFTALYDYVDYFVVNVSSPNTPGLRELQEKAALSKILKNLQLLNAKLLNTKPLNANPLNHKPILLKIAPDLTDEQLDDVIDLALEIKLDGLVATNTTISRVSLQTSNIQLQTIGAGGLSGLPVKERSTEVIKYIHQKINALAGNIDGSPQIPIIASGGIFTAGDAIEKINAGASLLQVWTGFIYEGPGIVKNICKAL
jgi:dihydroorotate dehydrogenase